MAEVKPEDLQLSVEKLQQHPELMGLMFIVGCLMMLILAGFFTAWTTAIVRWASKQSLLDVEPWTPRVWGLIDILLAGALLVVAQTVGLKLWAQATGTDLKKLSDESEFPLSAMAVGSLSYLVVMLLMLVWMAMRYGASPSHLGFNLRRMFSNLGLGLAAAVMWIPIVWIVMVVVSVGFAREYDHPLLDRLADMPSLNAYLLATFSAVAVAPITEEFLFRVLLQGWLQSLPWSQKGMWWLFGASQLARDAALQASQQVNTASDLASAEDVDTALNSPYAYPNADAITTAAPSLNRPVSYQEDPQGDQRDDQHDDQPPVVTSSDANTVASPANRPAPGISPPLWPVFVSGTLFGLAHLGYGLSFVPLILLGIILGLLYRARHSIWPSFAVHFTLNFISMLMLGISLLMQAVLK